MSAQALTPRPTPVAEGCDDCPNDKLCFEKDMDGSPGICTGKGFMTCLSAPPSVDTEWCGPGIVRRLTCAGPREEPSRRAPGGRGRAATSTRAGRDAQKWSSPDARRGERAAISTRAGEHAQKWSSPDARRGDADVPPGEDCVALPCTVWPGGISCARCLMPGAKHTWKEDTCLDWTEDECSGYGAYDEEDNFVSSEWCGAPGAATCAEINN